jgi:hypothetical protein
MVLVILMTLALAAGEKGEYFEAFQLIGRSDDGWN